LNPENLDSVGYIPGAYGKRMLLSKDGTRLYVTNDTLNLLQIIDTGTNSVIGSIPVNGPVGLALTPDEDRLLVSCDSGVAVVDLATQSITKYLGGFTQPKEIAIYGAAEAPALQVTIDIKPGSSVNPIQLKSKGKVPVAILGDPAFDVTTVDRGTVMFVGASPLSTGGLPEDVNGDGLLDLVLHFETQDLQLQPGDTQACLSGKTSSGEAFAGCDTIRVIELKAKKAYKQGKK
jgi:YVTN family beta-propeller protein